MKIGVLTKTVGFVNAQTGTDSRSNYICPEDIIRMLNPLDEVALEYALALKDRSAGVKVVAVSVGDRFAEEGLRRALAMGVDDAIHIQCEELGQLDAMATSALLARACERESFDLILCGDTSIDDNDGLEGPYLAGRLAIPHISRAVKVSVGGNRQVLEIERVVERGDRQLMQCSLPALLTVQKGSTVPRYPTLAGFLHAESSHVRVLTPADLEFAKNDTLFSLNTTRIAARSNPKPKKQRGVAERSRLSAAERIDLMVSRDATKGKEGGTIIDGLSEEMFTRLDDILEEAGILKR
ncbi:electron transfer flavoprotein subunit beta/FixA family protein [Geobacter argillaceus]|uniref:Electron transfer flavoprotein beta subunit n=1 Tax=Geobacter argillaceus TaxID=345631 RepID=A0A562V0C5_9BACT|nr:hypothetical protein [Geobacter argillaceus]TWJ11351.1 electron transfer flavoprotein beta subunit [Geobacter argillaceus]